VKYWETIANRLMKAGCIRLQKEMAEHFFDASHEGTPVIEKE
jgi:lipoprotein-anchoring transpeptidase ErfK/SrfK